MSNNELRTYYSKLYTIDNYIYNNKDINLAIFDLTELKGDVLYCLSQAYKGSNDNDSNKKQIPKKELRSLISDLDNRLSDLYSIKNSTNPYKQISLLIYHFRHLENNYSVDLLEDVFYFIFILIFSLIVVNFLKTSPISPLCDTDTYDFYIIIFIFIFFHLSRIKSISKDGIEFRKRKNW